jgi:hypothetical protein
VVFGGFGWFLVVFGGFREPGNYPSNGPFFTLLGKWHNAYRKNGGI